MSATKDDSREQLARANTIIDGARRAGRDLTQDEAKEVDSILDELDADVGKQLLRRLGAQRRITPPSPIGPQPSTSTGLPKLGQRGPRYNDLFGAPSASNFGSFQEFLGVIHSGQYHPDIQAAGMNEGVPSEGGFLVPEEFSRQILDTALEDELIRPRATIYPMQSRTLHVPGWDASDNSSGALFGGFTSNWLDEGATATIKTPKTRKVGLTAHKLALYTYASNELAADGINLDEQLSSAMVRATSWNLDYWFLNGTGAGQPAGILNAASRVTIPKEAGQTADTLLYENIVKMFSRMHPASVGKSIWIANPTCIPQLLELQNRVENAAANDYVGGSSVPVLNGSDGKFTLLTRPIFFSEKVPELGDEGDILLVDCSCYLIGMRREMSLEKSQHVRWLTDEVSYRGLVRVDGQPAWASAYTPRNGSTLSWAVVLAERA